MVRRLWTTTAECYFLNGMLGSMSFICVQSSLEFLPFSMVSIGAVLQIPGAMLFQWLLRSGRTIDSPSILSRGVLTLITLAFPLLSPEGVDGAMNSTFAIGAILLFFHILLTRIEKATFDMSNLGPRDSRDNIRNGSSKLSGLSRRVYLSDAGTRFDL